MKGEGEKKTGGGGRERKSAEGLKRGKTPGGGRDLSEKKTKKAETRMQGNQKKENESR